jgi:hypothetical protein
METIDNFSCYALQNITKPCNKENGGYIKAWEGLSLFIEKNGVSLELDENEIKQIIKTVGANWKRG